MRNSAEVAGLGGNVRFFRYNLDYQYNKTFFDYFVIKSKFNYQIYVFPKIIKNIFD